MALMQFNSVLPMMEQDAPAEDSAFLDLLTVPGLCQGIYAKLDCDSRYQLGATSRTVAGQIEPCVRRVVLYPPKSSTAEAVSAWTKRLASSALQPKEICIKPNRDARNDLHACFAKESLKQVLQRVEQLKTYLPMDAQVLEEIAGCMPSLRHLWLEDTPPFGEESWLDAFKRLPNMETLVLRGGRDARIDQGASAGFYSALQFLPKLRSLTAFWEHNYNRVAQLTQLQELTIGMPFEYWVGVEVAQDSFPWWSPNVLSGLSNLTSLVFAGPSTPSPSLWESQLASTLTALTRLQRLQLPSVSPGPVVAALGQMTGLTQLTNQHARAVPGLYLPGVQVLRASTADLDFFDELHAPQLQYLHATEDMEWSGVMEVRLTPTMSSEQHAAVLERCAGQVLRHCNTLAVHRGIGNPKPETVLAALQALGRCWRPDPSLVDGSSPFVQGNVHGRGDSSTGSTATGWCLVLSWLACSQGALAVLPQGLTRIELRSCVLKGNALEPLATLASLKELLLQGPPDVPAQPVMCLLSAATQGWLLKVELEYMSSAQVTEEVLSTHTALVAERGSRLVPILRVSQYLNGSMDEYLREAFDEGGGSAQ